MNSHRPLSAGTASVNLKRLPGFLRQAAPLLVALLVAYPSYSANPASSKGLYLDIAAVGSSVIAVGEHGAILISEDQGKTWTRRESPSATTLTSIFFLNHSEGWIVGHEGTILNTQDGGKTWSLLRQSPGADEPVFDIVFANERQGVAVGAFGLVLTTSDGGKTWNKTELKDGPHLYVAAIHQGRLWVGGEAGALFSRPLAAGDWKPEPAPFTSSIFGLSSQSKDRLIAFGFHGSVAAHVQSRWEKIANEEKQSWYGGVTLSDGKLILVGAKGSAATLSANSNKLQSLPVEQRADLTALAELEDQLIIASDSGLSVTKP